jgi:hypothetical protein
MLLLTHNAPSIELASRPYFDRYIELSKKCGLNLNTAEIRIEYMDTKIKYQVATCNSSQQIIRLDRRSFRGDDIRREQILFHELTHCLMSQGHNDIDLNIMNTSGFIDNLDYVNNYDMYIRKMFKVCNYKEQIKYEGYDGN